MNKKKIINDPVYGFITIPFEIIHDIIGHPWFQRLTRIRQLGLTYLVYPGAIHTRFHHTLGAMHLMANAIETLRTKGHTVTASETEAALIAILMHDIGHGPFSHALEKLLVKDVSHEMLSAEIMKHLNHETGGKFEEAMAIFNDTHPKKFLHQLVSSQLDVDRLDYLNRDSFFTGVSEGVISSDRIIKMLEIVDGSLVIEEKGIYSVEKFITARRLMYWQVYLHKTVLAAEYMLINIVLRARELSNSGVDIPGSEAFTGFLNYHRGVAAFANDPGLLEQFNQIDDVDVFAAIKSWCRHPDKVLSTLAQCLADRKLFRIEISKTSYDAAIISERQEQLAKHLGITYEEARYFVFSHAVENSAYSADDKINILFRTGEVMDIADASDNFNIAALTRTVTKHFICTYRMES